MEYTEVSANFWPAGNRVPTINALRDALDQDAKSVKFISVNSRDGFVGHMDTLAEGVTLKVVGPDPWVDRKWSAMITKSQDGTVTMDGVKINHRTS